MAEASVDSASPSHALLLHLIQEIGRGASIEQVFGVFADTLQQQMVAAETERARSHLLSHLLELSAQLNSNLSIPVLTERAVEAAMELVGARGGAVGLLELERIVFRRIRLDRRWEDTDIAVQRGEGIAGLVWERMRPYINNHWSSERVTPSPLQRKFGFQRVIAVPMVDRSGTFVGVLELHDPLKERNFEQIDAEALQLLAHQATIAMDNARLSQLKDEFLSMVSHELKTPVTSIKGFVQLLQRRLPADSLELYGHYLDVLNLQTDRLAGLINDLLDLSRMQQGHFTFDRTPFHYSDLIRDVLSEVQLMTPHHRLDLSVPPHAVVLGNADRIRQVLVNLIDNAVKYGPPETPIEVTVEDRADSVATYVCDAGSTLPASEGERIFGPYYQARGSADQYARGLGLGLYVSRQIIEGHGGRIWLDANDHTSFGFTLPHPPSSAL
jgi:signal transduction histidine kinase